MTRSNPNPADQELTVLNLNRQIEDLTQSLSIADRNLSAYNLAFMKLPSPPVGPGETFTLAEKSAYVENKLAVMSAMIASNTCGNCGAVVGSGSDA